MYQDLNNHHSIAKTILVTNNRQIKIIPNNRVTSAELIMPFLAMTNFITAHYYKRYLVDGVGARVFIGAGFCILNTYVCAFMVGVMLAMALTVHEMQVIEFQQ